MAARMIVLLVAAATAVVAACVRQRLRRGYCPLGRAG